MWGGSWGLGGGVARTVRSTACTWPRAHVARLLDRRHKRAARDVSGAGHAGCAGGPRRGRVHARRIVILRVTGVERELVEPTLGIGLGGGPGPGSELGSG